MNKLVDMTGGRYGKLLVIERAAVRDRNGARWVVLCECGTQKTVRGTKLRSTGSDAIRSCGCSNGGRRQHGLFRSPEYSAWKHMLSRCRNEADSNWQDYGGRGIKVCERWVHFESFLADMGKRPTGLTLERIRNDGNYEPGNVRWATRPEQSQNRRGLRLSPDLVRKIRADVAAGTSCSAVSKSLGLTPRYVRQIVRGYRWATVA
jgi:hypothetical protein